MRTIETKQIQEAVSQACQQAAIELPQDVVLGLTQGLAAETSALGKEMLAASLENAKIAWEKKLPICQDTGLTVVFVELGQDVQIIGQALVGAINEGVRQGSKQGYLRNSVVNDPLRRQNTGDNSPAVIHVEIVAGDKLKIVIAPKGAGSENSSGLKMLKPAEGWDGIKSFVCETIRNAGANPCPPIIVGVGIGGTMEKCALLAKKALLRPLGQINPDPLYSQKEKELLEAINRLGIGPQGLGGQITALACHIEYTACHIASLPVSVNIQCHAARHKEIIL